MELGFAYMVYLGGRLLIELTGPRAALACESAARALEGLYGVGSAVCVKEWFI